MVIQFFNATWHEKVANNKKSCEKTQLCSCARMKMLQSSKNITCSVFPRLPNKSLAKYLQ